MDLWHSVCKTDPAAVKPITGKQYQGNSPKPYWLIQRATETFGPVGIGWGCDVKSERFERLGEFDVLHVAVVSVWYVKDGVRSQTFDQMGGTKAAYKTAKGSLMVDEDAGKKSVTDGMVKCLSMIGFAGDIFSGRWDDSKYVAELRKEFAEERDEPEQIRASGPRGVANAVLATSPAIPDKRREYIDGFGMDIVREWQENDRTPASLIVAIEAEKLDDVEKIYLWTNLPSPMRTAIKAEQAAQRKPKAA